jgi:hypothetical protein
MTPLAVWTLYGAARAPNTRLAVTVRGTIHHMGARTTAEAEQLTAMAPIMALRVTLRLVDNILQTSWLASPLVLVAEDELDSANGGHRCVIAGCMPIAVFEV